MTVWNSVFRHYSYDRPGSCGQKGFRFVVDAAFLVDVISCSTSVGGGVMVADGRLSLKNGSLSNGELVTCVMSSKCVGGGVMEI